jgi:CBS domain-containing protein/sporulation protein YlmC with PRC-barrel domain
MASTSGDDFVVEHAEDISPDEPAKDAKRRMEAGELRSILVLEGNRPVGLIQRRQLLNRDHDELERPVSTYMLTNFPKIREGQSLEEVAPQLGHDINIEQYPIVNESGELVGVVHRDELSPYHSAGATGGTLHDAPNHEVGAVHEGMKVKDASGSSLGKLKDASFQTDGGVEFFIVEHGLIFKKEKQLPGDLIQAIDGDDVTLKISSTEFDMMRDIGDEV